MEYQVNSGTTTGPPSTGSSSNSVFLPWNSPFGDTTYTKIFVGGLPWETQNETLGNYFEQFGDILEAVVIFDKNTARSKGYGFVTFGDPESARRACIEPNPVIDGRRANCNLASLGRPQPTLTYSHFGPNAPIIGGVSAPQGAIFRSSGYQQPFPHGYPQAYFCPPYGYTSYGPEPVYQQDVYNPYMGQQYFQYHGLPGTSNLALYPYGSIGQPQAVSRNHSIQGYMRDQQVMHYCGSSINSSANSSFPTVHLAYHTGMPPTTAQGQPQYVIPVYPQVMEINDANRTA